MAKDSAKKPNGRPSKFTPELAALICEKVATSTCGLRKLCALHPELPCEDTINRWRLYDEKFSAQYARAKAQQADLLAEEILYISDDDCGDVKYDKDGNESCNGEFVARSRLRVDSRKWLASKLLPKVYGDKIQEEKTASESLIEKVLNGEVIISKNDK